METGPAEAETFASRNNYVTWLAGCQCRRGSKGSRPWSVVSRPNRALLTICALMPSGIEQVAAEIAVALTAADDPAVEGDRAALTSLLAEIIKANFDEEAAIAREAERTLESLPSTAGMDKGKLLAGLKERIAKQRGFVL